ncbi:hypothetical protein BU16DRAFT_325860 [Lophium mytilinum]|uniref:Uncharacterized protein n=1 Tax=Lophium mytilinum TaxID=390894 RepID=A0A6A6QZC1_9PEZI|nr:hypothetical protein BU16DRAFT_325860 [Lophium mytilinum]
MYISLLGFRLVGPSAWRADWGSGGLGVFQNHGHVTCFLSVALRRLRAHRAPSSQTHAPAVGGMPQRWSGQRWPAGPHNLPTSGVTSAGCLCTRTAVVALAYRIWRREVRSQTSVDASQRSTFRVRQTIRSPKCGRRRELSDVPELRLGYFCSGCISCLRVPLPSPTSSSRAALTTWELKSVTAHSASALPPPRRIPHFSRSSPTQSRTSRNRHAVVTRIIASPHFLDRFVSPPA